MPLTMQRNCAALRMRRRRRNLDSRHGGLSGLNSQIRHHCEGIRTVPQVATRGGGDGWLRDGSIPLRFQGGVAAPFIKRSRSSAAQTGWLENSNKNNVRYADIYKEATRPFTNYPVCAVEERDLFIETQPPLENG